MVFFINWCLFLHVWTYVCHCLSSSPLIWLLLFWFFSNHSISQHINSVRRKCFLGTSFCRLFSVNVTLKPNSSDRTDVRVVRFAEFPAEWTLGYSKSLNMLLAWAFVLLSDEIMICAIVKSTYLHRLVEIYLEIQQNINMLLGVQHIYLLFSWQLCFFVLYMYFL